VLGDNRDHSKDSRYNVDQPSHGFVPIENVVGRAFLITWPFSRFGTIDFHHDVFAGAGPRRGGRMSVATPRLTLERSPARAPARHRVRRSRRGALAGPVAVGAVVVDAARARSASPRACATRSWSPSTAARMSPRALRRG
jgi:hypothetical protein